MPPAGRARVPILTLITLLATAAPALAATWYQDADNDTYGNPSISQVSPSQPPGYVANNLDCNDANPAIYPGRPEICDGLDNDCDGQVDEGAGTTWYQDFDNDTYGSPSITTVACTKPNGYVANNLDCNDANPAMYPGRPEICDGLDNDCDGQIDEGAGTTWYQDFDNDTYGSPSITTVACTKPNGYVANNLDCNDANPAMYPGRPEICDGLDNDCDGQIDEGAGTTWYQDFDNDTYGSPSITTVACTKPNGYVANNLDCNDANPAMYPGRPEICDGLDNDCDGQVDEGVGTTWYQDADGDGHGRPAITQIACSVPPGFAATNDDCNDTNASIHPGAVEVCDGLDNDCDGITDESCVGLDITSVADVGNDQGRRVRVKWNRHTSDAAGSPQPITSYSLYRRIDGFLATSQARSRPSEAPLAAPPGDWDFVMTVPATGEPNYNAIAGTLCDSTSDGICWSVLFVRAHTATPATYFDSQPDSGYSIDNLAPNVPENLQVAYSASVNQLTWDESQATDFRYFRVYRGASVVFTPGPGSLAYQTTGTSWSDLSGGLGANYKVTAVDFSGNESPAAIASPTVGVPSNGAGAAFVLERPSPNPFTRDVVIAFQVPVRAPVRLQIFDAAGRFVRTLIDGELPAGRHVARWGGGTESDRSLPAGIYLVRLQSGSTVLHTKVMRAK